MQQPWGRYFDDYTVGEVIKHWPGRTIRDFDDTWFTLMTMNTNPIHFDEHFASQSQHGRCLVNGTLVFAIVVGMRCATSARPRSPTSSTSSSAISGRPSTATRCTPSRRSSRRPSRSRSDDRGVLYVETRAWNQKDEPVMSLRRRVMLPRRPA